MRKKFSLALIAMAAALLVPVASFAAALTVINGQVTNNGHGVSGAKVTIICDNNAKHTTTDPNGFYTVTFSAAKCPNGATAYGTATKGKKGGDSQAKVKPFFEGDTSLNIGVVNIALPEFGAIAGALALVGAAGAFLVTRRRELGQN